MTRPAQTSAALGQVVGDLTKMLVSSPDPEARQRASKALEALIEGGYGVARSADTVHKALPVGAVPGAGTLPPPNDLIVMAAERLRIVLQFSADPVERDRATEELNRLSRGWFANVAPDGAAGG